MNLAELIAQINWRPRIGDASLMGWLTVGAYGVATVLSFLAAIRQPVSSGSRDALRQRRLWVGLGVVMAFLGLNKQFDLQSLLTDIGRVLANRDGWYSQRRTIQFWFVVAVGAASVAAFLFIAKKSRSAFRGRIPLLLGVSLLLLFVVMRAASFHHVSVFLDWRILGFKLNWLMELGGIALVAGSAARAASCPSANGGRAA